MSKYKYIITSKNGQIIDSEEEYADYDLSEAFFETYDAAEDAALYHISCSLSGTETILMNDPFECEYSLDDEFEYKISNLPCVFDGVWLNCPLFETVGFNEVGIFMSRGMYGKNPAYKKYLRDPYGWFGEYLPDNTVIIASKKDKLNKQASKMFQSIACSIGYGSAWIDDHVHDWNVLYPYMDDWTTSLNVWALRCMTGEGFSE